MIMEVICSSETWVPTRATGCHILEDGVLNSHHRENLKSLIEIGQMKDLCVKLK
jgi:hypothetical protein